MDQGGAALALTFTAIAFAITVIFRADVEAQAGAYATGVLVLMLSAAVAVTLSVRRRSPRSAVLAFGLIPLVFAYTMIANIIERPDGVKIASFFIAAILATSLISRVTRATRAARHRGPPGRDREADRCDASAPRPRQPSAAWSLSVRSWW